MFRQIINRFSPILFLLAMALLITNLFLTTRSNVQASPTSGEVSPGLVPRFINFDIGATTLRSGAVFQHDVSSISDIAPYVYLPNSEQPIAIVNFTIPPDFDEGGNFDVRLLQQVAFLGNSVPCFYVLEAELVGYGSNHPAALFSPYWAGETSTSDEYIVQGTDFNIQELSISFQSASGFPAYPGDIVTFTLYRDAENVNDTCASNIIIRSISVTYQGLTSYLPSIQR